MKRRSRHSAGFAVGFVVLVIGVLSVGVGSALARTTAHTNAAATVVGVIAGKPSELAFKLSKSSSLPVGSITFTVKNEGASPHDFKVCSAPVATAAHNSCAGKVTKILKPGQSATLTVKFTKKGTYEYLCTEPGHAAGGMKGLIGVGVAVKVPAKTTTTTTSKSVCPNGQTIAAASPIGDNDADNSPGGPDDKDGCL